ncbi:AAA family ATPase [Acidiphilium sp. C61]|uniref:AAA family ATPase n=1 Tax=Acidiphilium sp. C61 TaxID=1671485 RepID=UPI001F46741D|nr:AAA family ATPase [Acidiphilium sp. C61]
MISAGGVIEQARYSTREMVGIERDMAVSADRMAEGRGGLPVRGFGVAARRVDAAVSARPFLAEEQRAAIEHVCRPERISAVVGLAGAGKSTMLAAAREAWVAQGYHVHGAALAGKAAEGLEESAGIASRTLASWERGWERGFDRLGPRDVLVIDEAGMVGSKQLSRFITEADRAGAKIVLVGDPEQLQPIGPGAAFRAVAERIGFLTWRKSAASARAGSGRLRWRSGGTRQRRVCAPMPSAMLSGSRQPRRMRGRRSCGMCWPIWMCGRMALAWFWRTATRTCGSSTRRSGWFGESGASWRTSVFIARPRGSGHLRRGIGCCFRENNRELGVKNGMLGTVELAEDDRLLVRLDSPSGPGRGRAVSVSMADYAAVDHGYATTIHKAQGATVDRAYVLASGTMDRHLTYVAMTRHGTG